MINYLKKSVKKSERGQAIILIAFAMVALVAMVGLVVDTGLLLINYGKLKRGVDAAAIAAAQQYRAAASSSNIDSVALENSAKNFLQLNQAENVKTVDIHTCDSLDPAPPELCNDDPGNQIDNRKLVEVTATADVNFSFLSVIGIKSTTISVTSIGEAATIDLVLVIDTSASMAYETSGALDESNAGDDPSVCNPPANTCMPMREVKNVAADFVDTLYLPYDRVAIITMTSQTPGGNRSPVEVIPLTSDASTVQTAITNIRVYEPPVCNGTSTVTSGVCRKYNGGSFERLDCEFYTANAYSPDRDPSGCPSSNVGGALALARSALTGSGDPDQQRLDAFWVVIALLGGPANSTDATGTYPNGFCPPNTYQRQPWCRDKQPSVRHQASDPLVNYTNPENNVTTPISLYDADDYARDMADNLATTTSGSGVTIYAIGLGNLVTSTTSVLAGENPAGEDLLTYIATCAGEGDLDDCSSINENDFKINHGQYFNATVSAELSGIFNQIANNIATKISQ
jgi:hypothetical protein